MSLVPSVTIDSLNLCFVLMHKVAVSVAPIDLASWRRRYDKARILSNRASTPSATCQSIPSKLVFKLRKHLGFRGELMTSLSLSKELSD